MPFSFTRLDVPDITLIEPKLFRDDRGFFLESFKSSEFEANGIVFQPVQTNYSHSAKGVLRGLHFQIHPQAQGKLVMVTKGEIFDVAVDIRKNSTTYGRWVGEVLSAENHRMLYVPIGFAHGFIALSEEADVIYQVTGGEYAPQVDRGIIWDDPEIGIKWPFNNPILSEKDARLPFLKDADSNFVHEAAHQ